MKKIYFIMALAIVAVSSCRFGGGSQSVSIRNNDRGYNFQASYPEEKAAKVVAYIEKTLKDDRIFEHVNSKKDADILLGDGAKFHLTAYPGFVEIDFKKNNNSSSSYEKLKELCQGIKDTL